MTTKKILLLATFIVALNSQIQANNETPAFALITYVLAYMTNSMATSPEVMELSSKLRTNENTYTNKLEFLARAGGILFCGVATALFGFYTLGTLFKADFRR